MKEATSLWKKRPDGMSEADYAGHENWTKIRWAWEFLRRNPDYIARSVELDKEPDKSEAKATAHNYGLKVFKPAWEDYKGKGVSKPKFLDNRIGFVARLTKDDPAIFERNLLVGDILIRINILAALKNTAAIKSKLRATKKAVQRKFESLSGASLKKSPYHHVKGHDNWLPLIRLRDAKAAGLRPRKYASAIFGNEALNTDPVERKSVVDQAAATAKKMLATGYRYIVVMPPLKPKKA